MASVSAVDKSQAKAASPGQVPAGRQVYTIAGRRYRWRWYKCKPLILMLWLVAGIVSSSLWLWLLGKWIWGPWPW